MAKLTGFPEAFHGDTSDVDTSAMVPVGTRASDVGGNEWVYANGTASVAYGDWVYFPRADYQVERVVADAIGPVAIAGSAIVASRYGWYQIYGTNRRANVATGATATNPLYLTSTAGRVGTTDVAGDFIVGATLQVNSASNFGTVFITHPFVTDSAIN